jgi:hypothetical protein
MLYVPYATRTTGIWISPGTARWLTAEDYGCILFRNDLVYLLPVSIPHRCL